MFLNEALGSVGCTGCVQARTNVRRGLEIGERPRGSGQLPCGGAQEDDANGKPFNGGFTPVDWRTLAMRFAGPHIRWCHYMDDLRLAVHTDMGFSPEGVNQQITLASFVS